jgi:dienelactone hydrolase
MRTSIDIARPIRLDVAGVELNGDLALAPDAGILIIFAHGSGSSRHSPRNQYVAAVLQEAGFATLLLDLLTEKEDEADVEMRQYRFNVELLAERLLEATSWVRHEPATQALAVGYFGASTGAAAAIVASADRDANVKAIVSRGGRPDLAEDALRLVTAPTLLIVGGEDRAVIPLNEKALAQLRCEKRLAIVPGATHLFEEPGALQRVAGMARQWFDAHLKR